MDDRVSRVVVTRAVRCVKLKLDIACFDRLQCAQTGVRNPDWRGRAQTDVCLRPKIGGDVPKRLWAMEVIQGVGRLVCEMGV